MQTPNYSTDAEAIDLLNVLVEKDYRPQLYLSASGNWTCVIAHKTKAFVFGDAPTIHEAIVAAVLQVIEKEELNWISKRRFATGSRQS